MRLPWATDGLPSGASIHIALSADAVAIPALQPAAMAALVVLLWFFAGRHLSRRAGIPVLAAASGFALALAWGGLQLANADVDPWRPLASDPANDQLGGSSDLLGLRGGMDGAYLYVGIDATPASIVPPPGGNHPPSFTSTAATATLVGETWSYPASADDPDGDTLFWSLSEAPGGMIVDGASGVVSWTPSAQGVFPVTLLVSDGRGGAATQHFTLNVAGTVPRPPNGGEMLPRFTTLPGLFARVGESWSYQPRAVDADGLDLTPSLVAGSAGMAIFGDTLRWTPPTPGYAQVMLEARDGRGQSVRQGFALGVEDRQALPPDPAGKASRLAATGFTPFHEATNFLYPKKLS